MTKHDGIEKKFSIVLSGNESDLFPDSMYNCSKWGKKHEIFIFEKQVGLESQFVDGLGLYLVLS